MKRLALALCLACVPFVALAAGSAEPTRTVEGDIALADANSLEIKVPVGDLHITGTGGDRVKAHLEIHCKAPSDTSCQQAAAKISLDSRNRGGELLLQVAGFPKLGDHGVSVVLKVEVPRAVRLDTNVGVGDTECAGMVGDLELGAGVGDVSITADKSKVHVVELDSGVGDVVLLVDGGRVEGSGLVGKGLDWSQGKGAAKVEVDTGVGDITVKLD
ncbi:MAG TPA: DUF4097 family beta strand repeat-containing protein [Thermoanaerobaculia bacterium]|nr:DUF4097 family beta strand repeat-containing protein [Thermoanaerobaculia bacterium]